MFDPKKPYNDLPDLPPSEDFNNIELLKLVNKANNSLFELRGGRGVCRRSIGRRVDPKSSLGMTRLEVVYN